VSHRQSHNKDDRAKPGKEKKSPSGKNSYGAHINQLFQDAIRDLKDLKPPARAKAGRRGPA
jgi:hypothetical protein